MAWLKLESPEEAEEEEEEMEGHLAGSCLVPQAGESLPLSAGEEGSLLVARSRPGCQRAPQGLYVSPAALYGCGARERVSEATCLGSLVS